MDELTVSPKTLATLEQLAENPPHALLLTAPAGFGKLTLAKNLAEKLLNVKKLTNYAYASVIEPEDGVIKIEKARELIQFMSLKVPANSGTGKVNRLAIIKDAETLMPQAQNALLKLLEEPPEKSLILLTSANPLALLSTVRSRTQIVNLTLPGKKQLEGFLISKGFVETDVKKALLISGGLPGLTVELLESENHELLTAAETARELLASSQFERLVAVNSLSKSRVQAENLCLILQQMARTALARVSSASQSHRWQQVFKAAFAANEALQKNAAVKLALVDLMLAI